MASESKVPSDPRTPTNEVLAERVQALDRLMLSEVKASALATTVAIQELRAAHDKFAVSTTEKFQTHNEFRLQIKEERVEYVTKAELRWLIGTVVALVFSVIGLFVKGR